MGYETIKLQGGVNAELTETLNTAGISQSNLIRFKNGLPQKLGGWAKFFPTSIGSPVRDLHAWEDLEAVEHLAVGADSFLGVITNGVLQDITPESNTLDFALPAFSTVSGSTAVIVSFPDSNVGANDTILFRTPVSVGGIVLNGAYSVYEANGPDQFEITAASAATSTVTNGGVVPVFNPSDGSATISTAFPNHGYSVGQTFTALASTAIAGLTIAGFYTVASVPDANNFTFVAAAQANATTTVSMNGGEAQIIDYLAPYLVDLNSGYGIGTYGEGGYGSGFPVAIHTGTKIPATNWSSDNYGELLVACAKDGPIFIWGPTLGNLYGQVISSAPIANGGIFVAMPEQILVAWGSSVLGIRDPLSIAWCDVDDYTNWAATVTDQAGSYRIPKGSAIIGGMQASQQALIWTDLAVWSMSYVGYPYVFGFNQIAAGCGLIAQHAAAELGAAVVWMSQKGFFVLSGGAVQPLPCTVWDVIFQNLNTGSTDFGEPFISRICAAPNSQFNEVAWHYPSAGGAGENDSYVKLNVLTGEWDYGLLERSAWIDQSVFGAPIAASPEGFIYQHEISNDADGVAMLPSFETAFFMIGEGEDWMFVDQGIADFKYGLRDAVQTATVQITLKGRDYPNETPRIYGPFTVTSTNPVFAPRARARYFSLLVESEDVGSFWRLGGIKFRSAPDGRNG